MTAAPAPDSHEGPVASFSWDTEGLPGCGEGTGSRSPGCLPGGAEWGGVGHSPQQSWGGPDL